MIMDYPYDVDASREVIRDPSTSATVKHAIILAAYPDELYGNPEKDIEALDPIEIWMNVEEDFRVSIPEQTENKVNAMMTALATNAFYERVEAFAAICSALYTGDMDDIIDQQFHDLTLPEMLWGIFEIELNREGSEEFAPGIVDFLERRVREEAEEQQVGNPNQLVSYNERFVMKMKNDMLRELKSIGVDDALLLKLNRADATPKHDDQGVWRGSQPELR